MSTRHRLGTRIRRLGLALTGLLLMQSVAGSPAASQTNRSAGVVVVVSAGSPITEISRLHLADLYLGRTTRFENGATAMPVDQRTGSTDRAVFSVAFLERSEAQMKAHWSKIIFTGRGRPPREVSSPEAVKELLRSNPTAIGYVDRRYVDQTLRVVQVY